MGSDVVVGVGVGGAGGIIMIVVSGLMVNEKVTVLVVPSGRVPVTTNE